MILEKRKKNIVLMHMSGSPIFDLIDEGYDAANI
jgi:hypothetical protein